MGITELDKSFVKTRIDEVLGIGRNLGKGEIQYYCPFCSHHKPKLQINLDSQKWRCWVCNSRGGKVVTLLKRLNVDFGILDKIKRIYGETVYSTKKEDEFVEVLLPSEYKPIIESQHIIEYRAAYNYLKNRGLSDADIKKHKIGYCDGGLYKGRLIIPSYDADGKLNYFLARSIYSNESIKYKNPPISKNVIAFDSLINWKMPITLCEGVFDAIAIKRNAIPILGKVPSKVLVNKILMERPEVNIALDKDALSDAIKQYQYLTNNNVKCKLVTLNDKDPSEIGFVEVTKQISVNTTSSFEDLIKLKLSL